MRWSPEFADRTVSRLIYLGLCIMALWAGSALINYSIETKFCKDYLLVWVVCNQRLRERQIKWPEFDGTNHAIYMNRLIRKMTGAGIYSPRSNTTTPYTYLLNRLWKGKEKIFVLLLKDRMIIYGMSRHTFERVDRYVDGKASFNGGRFRGKIGKHGSAIIGIWRM